jgi:N-methylhydantoinase A
MVETPVYDGSALGAGATLAGPAVVELMNTTILVLEGFDLVVDRFGSFVLYAGERGRQLAEQLAPELTGLTA